MLDIYLIRNNPDWVKTQLLKRMPAVDFAPLLNADKQKRKVQKITE